MGMATTSKQQLAHSYPLGLECCQAQPSRHISSKVRLARQPNTWAADSGDASNLGTSPARRGKTS